MKIALFTYTYFPEINGVATHVKTLKEGLERIGHQVLVVTAPLSFQPIARELTRAYIGYFAGKADKIIGPSAKVQLFLNNCGISREISVIPNAVELDQFICEKVKFQDAENLRKRYGLFPEDLVICFCGRLGKEKSVDV